MLSESFTSARLHLLNYDKPKISRDTSVSMNRRIFVCAELERTYPCRAKNRPACPVSCSAYCHKCRKKPPTLRDFRAEKGEGEQEGSFQCIAVCFQSCRRCGQRTGKDVHRNTPFPSCLHKYRVIRRIYDPARQGFPTWRSVL